MKKDRKLILTVIAFFLVASAILAGCKKEVGNGDRFKISAESYGGTDKVIVNGLSATWAINDAICINNTTGSVTAVDGNIATLYTRRSVNAPYYAVYPASLVAENTTLSGATVTVTLPDSYEYMADPTTGKQKLEMPMAATSSNEYLNFKHLTGALAINVTNSFSGGVSMNIVEVKVASNNYRISGNFTVDFSSLTTISPVDESENAPKQVRMVFPTPLTVTNGESASIMVPVAPVGDDNLFTIYVKVETPDGLVYLFKRQQPASYASGLARNEVGTVPVAMAASRGTLITDYIHKSFLGNGTQEEPYLIRTWADYKHFDALIRMNASSNSHRAMYANAYYLVTNDIDASSSEFLSYSSSDFGGHFNGGNHTINNIICKPSMNSVSSLQCFPNINGGTVENLTMNVTYRPLHTAATNGTLYLSGLSSKIQNGTVNNVTVNMQIESGSTLNAKGTAYIGGLASAPDCYGMTVSNCSITVSDINYSGHKIYFGGLIPLINTNGADHTSSFTGNVITLSGIGLKASSGKEMRYGGLVGQINGGTYVFSGNTLSITNNSLEVNDDGKLYAAGAFGNANNNVKTIRFINSNVLSGSITYTVPSTATSYIKKILDKSALSPNGQNNNRIYDGDETDPIPSSGNGSHFTVSNLNFYDATSTSTDPVATNNY